MSEPTNIPTSSPRATIILDAGILMRFACPISDANRSEAKRYTLRTYLDLLPFFARHGYRILIPEMVAYETAHVLADGTSTKDIFQEKYADNFVTRPFLEAVARGRYPNIEIVTQTGPEKVDLLLDDITRTMHMPLDSKWDAAPKSKAAELARSRSAQRIMDHDNRDDYGDDAILSLIHKLKSMGDTSLVVVLTNDNGLRDRLPKSSMIEHLNDRMWIHRLVKSGLHKNAGLACDVSPDSIAQQLCLYMQPFETGDLRALEQFTPNATEHFITKLHATDSPLFHDMKNLRKSLNRGEISPPAEEAPRRSAVAQRLFDSYEARRQKAASKSPSR